MLDPVKYANVTVTLADMRHGDVDYCSRGARAFAKRYGLDMRKFLDEGLPASDFIATGDAMAEPAILAAAKRMGIE